MKKLAIIATAICCCIQHSYAQNVLGKFKQRIAENAAKKINGDPARSAEKSEQKKSGSPEAAEEQKKPEEQSADPAPAAAAPKLASYSRFDFVPGNKIIFWEDFSQDAVGEFPLQWFTRSKGETVTLNNAEGKWLRMYPGGFLSPTVLMKENYTVEFDLILDFPVNGGFLVPSFGVSFYDRGNRMEVFKYDYELVNNMAFRLTPFRDEAFMTLSTREMKKPKFDSEKVKVSDFNKKAGKPVHVALSIQKERIRIWLDEEKVFDVPSVVPYPGDFNQLKFEMNSSNYKNDQIGYYISNIKIAAGEADLRTKILKDGKYSTSGIRFNSGSDMLRPESFGTINEIAKLLKQEPSLQLMIIGHTDATGSSDDNTVLSQKRAQAVMKVLIEDHKIDASRLKADGKGSAQPVTDNKTAEGRAMNRRVEFNRI